MSFDYNKTASTAARLIDKFGLTLTFTHTTQGAHVPGSGSSDTETTHNTKCAWLNYMQSEINGENIKRGDAKVLCDPQGYQPIIGDTVVYNEKVWRVVDVGILSPAGTDVLYTIQVRK